MTAAGVGEGVDLVVIAKEPVAGRVKTRLCPPCTPDQAAEIALACLLDTFDTVLGTPARRRVVALDGCPGAWIPAGFEVVDQRGDGLDERIGAVLDDADGPTLIIGMDTPQLSVAQLVDAAARLGSGDADAVVGPAADGGYWCIGMTEPGPAAVTGVPMSTDHTLADQLGRLSSMGLRTVVLDELRDIDEFADAVAVAAGAPDSRLASAVAGVSARSSDLSEPTEA